MPTLLQILSPVRSEVTKQSPQNRSLFSGAARSYSDKIKNKICETDKVKTDKLFYRIFLNQPSLISELIPEIPRDCQFDYNAPVVKEKDLLDSTFSILH